VALLLRFASHARDVLYRYRLVPTREFEYVSPAATALTGYTPEEHYADPDLGFKIVHPEDRPSLERYLAAARFEEPFTARCIRKDGRVIWTGALYLGIPWRRRGPGAGSRSRSAVSAQAVQSLLAGAKGERGIGQPEASSPVSGLARWVREVLDASVRKS
jgi:PAS domain-containing protein